MASPGLGVSQAQASGGFRSGTARPVGWEARKKGTPEIRRKELMPEFVTLTCPSCGGKLEITEDIERFACANCGTEHLVKRGGGTILIRPITDGLAKVQTGVDRTAAELAIVRLKKEIPALKDALENKNMELQAEADYLLELSTETKKAERRKLREYAVLLAMSVVLIAISIRLSNVARSGYLPYLSRWGPIFLLASSGPCGFGAIFDSVSYSAIFKPPQA